MCLPGCAVKKDMQKRRLLRCRRSDTQSGGPTAVYRRDAAVEYGDTEVQNTKQLYKQVEESWHCQCTIP
ncbi:hypothetical protein NDU88_005225 [Pleurodeles waltl]|uniref:Uncharacterized protein n=1 Tax=Pleurodeles waltl TaxID=8319 RepID=A0AAV7PHY4_PLEWA|nr:hypothetical protein NDU88_005225 [Pleurodeles waltl]